VLLPATEAAALELIVIAPFDPVVTVMPPLAKMYDEPSESLVSEPESAVVYTVFHGLAEEPSE
jgi:hypothetical protein